MRAPIVALIVAAMMTFFVTVSNAQASTGHPPRAVQSVESPALQTQEATPIRVVEALPDGEFVVSIAGVEQRTITSNHARRIAPNLQELERLMEARPLNEQQIAQLRLALDLSKRDRTLTASKIAAEHARAANFRLVYEGENGLHLQAESL
ncbi:MAG: hypothetical protein AUG51_17010 [Acidobacteria bacterium 13_1_20CM_3_53_8]|nr:MAG: hypothetical protein AUG51_17010 [Acidobacteria bacterium 13_1_20CM_3_53_8]